MGRKAKRLRLFKIQEEIQEKKMAKQRAVEEANSVRIAAMKAAQEAEEQRKKEAEEKKKKAAAERRRKAAEKKRREEAQKKAEEAKKLAEEKKKEESAEAAEQKNYIVTDALETIRGFSLFKNYLSLIRGLYEWRFLH